MFQTLNYSVVQSGPHHLFYLAQDWPRQCILDAKGLIDLSKKKKKIDNEGYIIFVVKIEMIQMTEVFFLDNV